nr:DUF4329 domain-containing protein [Lachnospiraceae bacterium]
MKYNETTTYEFRPGSGTDTTSVMPKSQTQVMKDMNGTQTDSLTTGYTYDDLGNIRTVKEGTVQKLKYYYDDLNQLIREDNKYLNKTITYSYDLGGNLTSVSEYTYQTGDTVTGTPTATNSYTYGDSNWKDKLTSYNGHTITYDAIGNPLQYHNGYTFTWQRGRQLAAANNGTNSISYTYNSDGIRTAKTVNGVTTNYVLEGTKVVFETDGTDTIWYYCNAAGTPVGFRMNTGNTNALFLYRKNLQGDITGIYVGYTGELMVSYKYDAWGKVTATNEAGSSLGTRLINKNAYLYRGYRYDRETGLYYLNSRYYDPETGRFINADGLVSTGQGVLGNNMFAYCLNNPANREDTSGEIAHGLRSLWEVSPDYKTPTGRDAYDSAHDAAIGFAEKIYETSMYVRHEFSGLIYSKEKNGKTVFRVTPAQATYGKPHESPIQSMAPGGGTAVAYIHTHTIYSFFSDADIIVAEEYKLDAYLITPTQHIQYYALGSFDADCDSVSFTPIKLSDTEKTQLVIRFRQSWDEHIRKGCDNHCEVYWWPNE